MDDLFQSIEIAGRTILPYAESGFIFEKLTDWYSLPDSKSEVRERPTSDGAFGIDRDPRRSLALSLEGFFASTSHAEALAAKEDFLEAIRAPKVQIRVTDALRTTVRTVDIRRVSVPDHSRPSWKFSIDMIATDPRRYGDEFSPSTGLPTAGTGLVYPLVYPLNYGSGGDPGRVAIVNPGTSATDVLLEVSGGLSGGVELVELSTGSYLRLERSIPLGSVVVFNTRTGRVYLDVPANDVSGFLTRRDWGGFTVPAGGSRTVQFNGLGTVTGAPILTARYSPAF